MVRLKGNVRRKFKTAKNLFQFLMVRLKDKMDYIFCGRDTVISIPYGAIKRHPQFAVLSAFFYISIPYGAIKSILEAIPNIIQ